MKDENKTIPEPDKPIPELDKLKKELEAVIKEKDQYLAGWQRARADHLNYIRDEQERFKVLVEYSNEGLVMELLPILDSFEKADKAIPQGYADNQIIRGFLQIGSQLKTILKNQGLEEINIEVGQKFNPENQEIIGTVENPALEDEIIAEVSLKGYLFKGKMVRPAQVKIIKNNK